MRVLYIYVGVSDSYILLPWVACKNKLLGLYKPHRSHATDHHFFPFFVYFVQ